jgi:hypothetical protein
MASNVCRDDRDTPHHPIEHRDIIRVSKKRDYTPIFYPKDSNSLNQTRAHLWQEAYIYLSKIPKRNLSVKRVPIPNLF